MRRSIGYSWFSLKVVAGPQKHTDRGRAHRDRREAESPAIASLGLDPDRARDLTDGSDVGADVEHGAVGLQHGAIGMHHDLRDARVHSGVVPPLGNDADSRAAFV